MYLFDTSIWSWAHNEPQSNLARKLTDRLAAGELVIASVVVLEVLHAARSWDEFRHLSARLALLPIVPITTSSCSRALDVQAQLASAGHGNHRRPAADFLLAAAAEEAGPDVTLWFLDKDLRVICEHTGQPYESETKL
jgi:predicted nucleic acid-binding protein